MKAFRGLLLLVVAVFATGGAVQASDRYDPRLRFRTLATRNFDIHFHQGEDALAQRLAALAEAVATELEPKLGRPNGRVHVILVNQDDVSNGWATPVPFNVIEIVAAAPRGIRQHDVGTGRRGPTARPARARRRRPTGVPYAEAQVRRAGVDGHDDACRRDDGREELYDLTTDPHELNDLVEAGESDRLLQRYRAESYPDFRSGPQERVPGLALFTQLPPGSNPRTVQLAAEMRADPRTAGGSNTAELVRFALRKGLLD